MEAASGVLEWAHAKQLAGTLTREQAMASAAEAIGRMRYGSDDYFWINDLEARIVMHPIRPALNGTTGEESAASMEEINAAVEAARAGESGRGFAVVNEVAQYQLAHHMLAATQES